MPEQKGRLGQRAAIEAAVRLVTQLVAEAEDIRHLRLLIVLADEKVRYEVTKQFPNAPVSPREAVK
jgi:hypothetical protein